jgi:hypothetical protein
MSDTLSSFFGRASKLLTDVFSDLQMPQIRGSREPEVKETWDIKHFERQLHWSLVHGISTNNPPNNIDLTGISNFITKFKSASKDGNEYGCFGLSNPLSGELTFSKVAKGNPDYVQIAAEPTSKRDRLTNLTIPTLMMHSHTLISGRTKEELVHFSPQDFSEFMSVKTLQSSIVLTPLADLILLKTANTRAYNPSLNTLIEKMSHAAINNQSVDVGRRMMRFTKEVAGYLGLELYLAKSSENGLIARRIKTS